VVVFLRDMGFSSSPDARANPGKSRQYHVDEGAQDQDLRGAISVGKGAEIDAQRAIREGENAPGDKARGQQVAGPAHKAKDRHKGDQAECRGGDDVALQGEILEGGEAIGSEQPSGESKGEADTRVHTGARRRVTENAGPSITREVRPNRHDWGTKFHTSTKTRSYEEGCVTSAATGALGALSLPERSTAVTLYQ
jgi:hypothetical protein